MTGKTDGSDGTDRTPRHGEDGDGVRPDGNEGRAGGSPEHGPLKETKAENSNLVTLKIDGEETAVDVELLRERFRSMAFLLTGDADAETECAYCHQQLPLGEALLTAHLAGVLAHVRCPPSCLAEVMQAAQPEPGFDFEDFMQAVDRRLDREPPQEQHGEITANPAPASTKSGPR